MVSEFVRYRVLRKEIIGGRTN
uniref:Uncharacterized protein n=1 Tax=Vitis vinifera TaxID=29760 RepID=F6I3B3_VITVI